MGAQEKEWAEGIAKKILDKVTVTAKRSKGKVPYTTVDGRFDDWSDRISWWTNGFYAGQLWQLYQAFGGENFRTFAEEVEEKLDANLMDYQGMDHDSGFKWLLTAAANYKLTGNPKSKNRTLLAAANLAGRFNPVGNYIRAWNNWGNEDNSGWAIIDCMMNLPLLYWAERETGDPRFAHVARLHANTAMKAFVREDGSVHHIVQFDAKNGGVTGTLGGQGYGVGSSWTRGQAWALYGFTLSYMHAQDTAYLETAKRIATYFANSVPESGLVPVDFCQPADCEWEDSTAAAIAACGMLELSKCVEEEEMKRFFFEAAMKLLKTLAQKRCNWSEETDNILENCTAAYHDQNHNFAIIYGDYYFTEAILKLCEKELFMW